MGVIATYNKEQVTGEMTTNKPKERQFQLVPVPGTFTRGRWKCWDYKDKSSETPKIIDFTDKSEKHSGSIVIGDSSLGHRVFNLAHTDATAEPNLMKTETSISAKSHPIDVPNPIKESSTIVVTSIAPSSVTPVNGTPSSPNISPVIINAAKVETKARNVAIGGGDNTIAHEKSFHQSTPAASTHLKATATVTAGNVAQGSHVIINISEASDSNSVMQPSLSSETVIVNVPSAAAEFEDS
ncbi:unnamed protein product [Thelazia callipaeda]|uniref:AT-hook motif nuclear-localized protein n=1 Tax=Thelazia callipaeda TaxID=103827 RepID=A0A0N5D1K8_THECL|nr:unnamed protein product [Thelazia callipaeda]